MFYIDVHLSFIWHDLAYICYGRDIQWFIVPNNLITSHVVYFIVQCKNAMQVDDMIVF